MKAKHFILFLLIIMLLIPTATSCMPKDDPLTSDLGVSRGNSPHNGWSYYSLPDGLYKIRTNGEDKTLIIDKIPLAFSIYEDRIYYIPVKKDPRLPKPADKKYSENISIYSCSINGDDEQVICETQFDLAKMGNMQLKVVNGWIFIGFKPDESHADYDLYRMRVDDIELTMISQTDEFIYDYSIDSDGWIYYITVRMLEDEPVTELYRMSYDGIVKEQLMQEVAWAMDYSDNEIFYIGEHGKNIYAVYYTGTFKRKVVECKAWAFIKVIGDWVYYIDAGDDPGLYKFKTDGSNRTKIPVKTLPRYGKMTIVDNWLTYLSEDMEYIEMIRISDMYDTDDLLDQINTEIWEALIRELSKHNTDDPLERTFIDKVIEMYENFEVRKYE